MEIDLRSISRDDQRLGPLARQYDAALNDYAIVREEVERLPSSAPQARVDELAQQLEDAEAELERTEGNLRDAASRELHPRQPVPASGLPASARGELRSELTYRPDTPATSFFRDAWVARENGDLAARERLERNSREQAAELRGRFGEAGFRDIGSGAVAGLVVPQYLVDQFVPLARAGFPLFEHLRRLPLPAEGLTVNISRLTTGTAVAAQATENTAVQETDADDTLLTVNVRTYAGMQDVSRQAIERGSNVDQVIFGDLVRAYFTKVSDGVLNADGTNGTHLGIRSTGSIISVAYTDASPTVPELWPKLQSAIAQVNSNIYAPASVILMTPTRWAWLNAALDSSNRPLVVPDSAVGANPFAVGNAAGYGTPVGSISGLPVITDANIPTNLGAGTNEDAILVLGASELFYWGEGDGMPRQLKFEQANAPQSIRLAVWGYSAFTAGRYPAASAVVGGTGLVGPSL